jgi:hypothetical protein
MKKNLIKATLKNPLEQPYVEIKGEYLDDDKIALVDYKIKPKSLFWNRGQDIYVKNDFVTENCLCPMKKGEVILAKNPDDYAIVPTLNTINNYSKYKNEQSVTGYIEDDMFVIL